MAMRTQIREWLKLASSHLTACRKPFRGHRRRGMHVESLEPRTLLTNYIVSNLNDAGVGSLRQAILDANGNAGADTVTFGTVGEIMLSSGSMQITDSLTINGTGRGNTIVDGQQQSRIFEITDSGGDVTLNSLSLRNGKSTLGLGGAILSGSAGSLEINNSALINNTVTGSTASGGAIHASLGAITINNSSLNSNSASATTGVSRGGAIFAGSGTVTIDNDTWFLFNSASSNSGDSHGGAIFAHSAVSINLGTFHTNSTQAEGTIGHSRGGAIFADGAVTVNQSTLNGNSTSGTIVSSEGGAIFAGNAALTISQSTISGNFADSTNSGSHGGAIFAYGATTISKSLLSGNSAIATAGSSLGGAIFVVSNMLTINQSDVSGNSTAATATDNGGFSRGGAIHSSSGAVTISESTLAANSTTSNSDHSYSSGGAISATSGAVTISQSTLSGNSATATSTNGNGQSKGGAILAGTGAVTISQSTLTGNSTTAVGTEGGSVSMGGAIFAFNQAAKTIRNSIVAGNTSPVGADMSLFGTVTVTNSLIGSRDNTGLIATVGTTPDSNGNFIGETTDATKIDPKLGPLANNGGTTMSHALRTGSLAIDRGSNADAVDVTNGNVLLTTDQRGGTFARISSNIVDMGAFEAVVISTPIVVDTTMDENDGDLSAGDVSLREAIALANLSPGANSISFSTAINGQPINLASELGQMEITDTLTITGNGAVNTILDAQQQSRIFEISDTAGDVTLNELTLRNGRTTGDGAAFSGGAIRAMSSGVLTIRRSHISGNSTTGSSANGGAIFINSGNVLLSACTISGNAVVGNNANGGALYAASGMVTVSGSTLSQNTASGDLGNGGAICSQTATVKLHQNTFRENSTAGAESRGGAVAMISGALTASQSTFSHNMTTGFSGDGGAIFSFSGSVTIIQSTLSGNSVAGDEAQGGAIHVYSGPLNLSQSTVTDNHATKSAAGGIFSYTSEIAIKNSIIAGNSDIGDASDLRPSPTAVMTVSNSLIGRSDGTGLTATLGTTPDAIGNFIGGTTDATKIDPKLGPLANNGGTTQTHALLTGSLAIDRGSNANAVDVTNGNTVLSRDQRGSTFSRFVDGDLKGTAPAAIVDMGAVEFSGLRLNSPSPTTNSLRPALTWTAIAGATSYNIWVNNLSTGVAQVYLASSPGTGTSHIVTLDFAIGKYKVFLQPVFASGVGNWNSGNEIFVLPPVVLTTMPPVQLVPRPTISWNALPGAVKYDLWIRNVTDANAPVETVRQEVTEASFTPSADLPMGIYRVWVRGVDKIGNFGAWSVVYQAKVVPGATPIGPLSGTFDRTPTFSWQPVSGAVRYEVYVRNSSAVNVYNGQSTTATNWTPTVNLPDGSYRWWVIAVGSTGLKSGSATTTEIFVGGRPTLIAPVPGSSTADRTPTFTWKAVEGAANYTLVLKRIVSPTVQTAVFTQGGLTGTSFKATTPLTPGTYRAWVKAISTTGESSPSSSTVDFTITAASPALELLHVDGLLTELLISDVFKVSESDSIDHGMAEFAGEQLGVSPPRTHTAAVLSAFSTSNVARRRIDGTTISMPTVNTESHSEG